MDRVFWVVATLWRREMVRFYRQPSRVIGALGSPFVFWLLIGSGIGTSFRSSGAESQNYLEYFFPGTILLILLFTSIFSTISLIEDRRQGFLQGVLIAPIPRTSFVLGKIFGGTTLAFLQGILFLSLGPWMGMKIDLSNWLGISGTLFITAFALAGLGFFIAWQFHSIQGFHAVMNLFLIPIWILSGALFPASGASNWLRAVMICNPLSYSLALIRHSLFGSEALEPAIALSAVITLVFGFVCFILSTLTASSVREGDVQ